MQEELKEQLTDGLVKSKLYGEVLINSTPITKLLSSEDIIENILFCIAEPVSKGHNSLKAYKFTLSSYFIRQDDTKAIQDLRTLGVNEKKLAKAIKRPLSCTVLEATISYDIQFKGVKGIRNKDKIIKAYEEYIDSPFSDGYTTVALENKFSIPLGVMKELYEKHKQEQYKEITTKEQAYDKIKEVLDTYNNKKQFGNCIQFPSKDIEDIITSCNHNLEPHEN